MPRLTDSSSHPLLLFDGVCGLCNRSVDFIIAHDRHAYFRFAPLQSAAGQAALAANGLRPGYFDSVVLIHNGHTYTHSAAALQITRLLGWPWKIVFVLIVIPPFIRNAAYRFIASHRYQWFGRRETCRVPTPAEREQFITDADAAPTMQS